MNKRLFWEGFFLQNNIFLLCIIIRSFDKCIYVTYDLDFLLRESEVKLAEKQIM